MVSSCVNGAMRPATIPHGQMTLTVGSLFSGIGGLDLGLERAGMKVIWQSEIDPYCNKVLKKHWPEVPNHGNIKDINWETVERPNVICGGYPCQPFSTAGKRRGTDDPRHLWPWVRTAISELQPDYAILENVKGHLSMGGLQVIGELAEIGYDAEWRVVSAAGVGAPHRRERIIIVAYPNGNYSTNGRECENVPSQDRSWRDDGSGSGSNLREISLGSPRETTQNVADADYTRNRTPKRRTNRNRTAQIQERQNVAQFGVSRRGKNVADADSSRRKGRIWSQEISSAPTGFDNTSADKRPSNHWFIEPRMGRVANGVSARVDRLKGLGNAVVPQVAEYIGRLIVNAQ